MKAKLIAVLTATFLTSYSALSEVDLLITGGTVISPINKHRADVKPEQWLAIVGNKIVDMGKQGSEPKAKKVIDATGQFVIPGLMDSHVHMTSMPGLSFSDPKAKQMQKAFFYRQGSNYLYHGVTQVIDPANTREKVAVLTSLGLVPDIFYCGAMPVLNGYNAVGIEQKDLAEKRPYYVAQETDPVLSEQITRQHSAKRAVTRMVEEGAQCAKVFIENGFNFANHIPVMSLQNLQAVTEQARKLNLPVMAHANATDMQEIAINAEVDIFAHGLWNWLEEQEGDKGQKLPQKVQKIADQILSHGIAYQPTINVMRSLRDLMVEGHLKDPAYRAILPQWQIDWYLSETGQWFAQEMFADWRGLPKPNIIKAFDTKLINGLRVLKYLYDGGGTILLGSDTPPAATYASQPGLASYWELKSFARSGIDLAGILAAATLNNAQAYNLESQYGTVETGKIANLLLLNSNPLQRIEAYNDIDMVVLQGEVIKRSDLHVDALDGQIVE